MKEQLKEKIFQEIERKNIIPKPKWHFLLKDGVLWFVGIIALLAGSISISSLLFLFLNIDGPLARALLFSGWKEILSFIPFLWIILGGIFLGIAWYNLRHTQRGYRFHIFIGGMLFVLPLVFGIVFYAIGGGHLAEFLLGKYVPKYETFMERQQFFWHRPEKGFLAGKIFFDIEQDKKIRICDVEGKEWTLLLEGDDSLYEKELFLQGTLVRMRGSVREEGFFEAESIVLWKMKGAHHHLMRKEGVYLEDIALPKYGKKREMFMFDICQKKSF
jgi:hypothetical protein